MDGSIIGFIRMSELTSKEKEFIGSTVYHQNLDWKTTYIVTTYSHESTISRSEEALAAGIFLEGRRYRKYTFHREHNPSMNVPKVDLKWLESDPNKAMYSYKEGEMMYYKTVTFDKTLPKAITPTPHEFASTYGITEVDCLFYNLKLVKVMYEQ